MNILYLYLSISSRQSKRFLSTLLVVSEDHIRFPNWRFRPRPKYCSICWNTRVGLLNLPENVHIFFSIAWSVETVCLSSNPITWQASLLPSCFPAHIIRSVTRSESQSSRLHVSYPIISTCACCRYVGGADWPSNNIIMQNSIGVRFYLLFM